MNNDSKLRAVAQDIKNTAEYLLFLVDKVPMKTIPTSESSLLYRKCQMMSRIIATTTSHAN